MKAGLLAMSASALFHFWGVEYAHELNALRLEISTLLPNSVSDVWLHPVIFSGDFHLVLCLGLLKFVLVGVSCSGG